MNRYKKDNINEKDYSIFFCLIICWSCSNPGSPDSGALYEDIKSEEEYTFEFYDTSFLEVQNESLRFVEPLDNKPVIGYGEESLTVFLFDKKGKVLFSFNHKGDGPKEYNSIFKLGVVGEYEILIIDSKKINIYSFEGGFTRTCRFANFNDLFPAIYDNEIYEMQDGKILISSLNNNFSAEQHEYYDSTHLLSLIDLEKCNFYNFGEIPEDAIYRRSKKYFIPLIGPKYHFNRGRNSIYVILPLNKKILNYHPNGELANSWKTSPERFAEPFGMKAFDPGSQLIILQKNAYYKSINSDNNLIYLLYIDKKGGDKLYTSAYDESGIKEIFFKRDHYMEIYDFSGKKISRDIFVSKDDLDILTIKSRDSIVFYKSINTEDESNPEQTVFIYGKLVKKNK